MSRQSTKTAGRTAKAGAVTSKKTAKPGRPTAKKAANSGRRPVGKATRAAPKAVPNPPIAPLVVEVAPPIIRTPSPPVQPAAPEMPVRSHRYRVGETVYYTSPSFGRAAATGSYTVVKLLPSEGDDYQYRIKSSGEAFERVAKESQLDKA